MRDSSERRGVASERVQVVERRKDLGKGVRKGFRGGRGLRRNQLEKYRYVQMRYKSR